MTPEQFAQEYLRREADAMKRKEGADCCAILSKLANEHGWTYEAARSAVLDYKLHGDG